MSNDSTSKTFLVAFLLCVVCSVLVSTAAVTLRPVQEEQKALDKKKIILGAAGFGSDKLNGMPQKEIEQLYTGRITAKLVDLATGQYAEGDANAFDQKKSAKDPATSIVIENDPAGIGRRSKIATIYIVKDENGKKTRIILPVHGKGLWSTLYGFFALDINDMNTIKALSFYSHAETPGLGGEVDNPNWKKLWDGKEAFGPNKDVKITVIKGKALKESPNYKHEVDGLAGATITARGVANMLAYWLGDDGFGKFIETLRKEGN